MFSSNQNLAVECRGLVKSYGTGGGQVLALRGIDLSVQRGELFMLVGPSGCGKTTLISVIAGILNFDGGSCTVLGQNYAGQKPRTLADFRAKNIGFVFQSYNLLPALTAAENVAVPLIIAGTPWAAALAKARTLLADVGLAERAGAYPSQLSGGQMQRVAIARALVHQPGIVVCDEPTSALDHETGEKVMQLMQSIMRRHGVTLIVVTHDNRIYKYASRIAHMDDGKIMRIEEHANAYA